MKTAVSLPDDLFRKADATARHLQISRSQLYATAISEYLHKHDPAAITSRLNDIYSEHTAQLDPAINNAQIESLDEEIW
jgi:metal-responsive CopG/Arc/MetJ family transcriptional regulator